MGKNREREGSWNSSEGDGSDGGVAAGGEIPNSVSGLYAAFVGVRCGGFGEEDRIMTSAELVMVASGAFGLFLLSQYDRVGRLNLRSGTQDKVP